MSTGGRMAYQDAYALAEEVAERLGPTVQLLKCVGSLRRRRDSIGDLEFLARPYSSPDLFGGPTTVHLEKVREVLNQLGTWKKGASRMMQITDLLGRKGTRLELYIVHPDGCDCKDCHPWGPAAWGSMLAIRTGPEDLGRYVVTKMRAHGYKHDRGQVRRIGSGELVPTETEESFFELAGVHCAPPWTRDDQAAHLWKTYGRPTL